MQIHFDWTITPAAILSALWFLFVVPAYRFLRNLNDSSKQIMVWLSEYRPHAHVEHGENTPLTTDGVVFPRDLRGK